MSDRLVMGTANQNRLAESIKNRLWLCMLRDVEEIKSQG